MNKKGFTLIELLVTIVIILSILGLSIVSISKVSDKKKEEAYTNVVSQIETAAKEYFENNKALYDGLSNGQSAVISLKELIETDYLSAVSNPITGKKLNECEYVKVEKNNGKYNLKYAVSEEPRCSDTYQVLAKIVATTTTTPSSSSTTSNTTTTTPKESTTTTTTTTPKAVVNNCTFNNLYVNNSHAGWNNRSTGAPQIKFNITAGSGASSLSKIEVKDGSKTISTITNFSSDIYTYNNETSGKTLTFVATDNKGGTCSKTVSVKYDKTSPVCSLSVKSSNDSKMQNGWYNIATGKPVITYKASDSSGTIDYSFLENSYTLGYGNDLSSVNKTYNAAVGSTTYKLLATDEAGNKCETSQIIKYDNVKPTITVNLKDSANNLFKDGNHIFDQLKCQKDYGNYNNCRYFTGWKCQTKSGDINGSLDYSSICYDSGSGVSDSGNLVMWNLDNTNKKSSTNNTSDEFKTYSSWSSKMVSAGVNVDNHIDYRRKCIDKAGNESLWMRFDMTVKAHTACYGRYYNGTSFVK